MWRDPSIIQPSESLKKRVKTELLPFFSYVFVLALSLELIDAAKEFVADYW